MTCFARVSFNGQGASIVLFVVSSFDRNLLLMAYAQCQGQRFGKFVGGAVRSSDSRRRCCLCVETDILHPRSTGSSLARDSLDDVCVPSGRN